MSFRIYPITLRISPTLPRSARAVVNAAPRKLSRSENWVRSGVVNSSGQTHASLARHLCHQRRLQSDLYDFLRAGLEQLASDWNTNRQAILIGEETCFQVLDGCAWPRLLGWLPR